MRYLKEGMPPGLIIKKLGLTKQTFYYHKWNLIKEGLLKIQNNPDPADIIGGQKPLFDPRHRGSTSGALAAVPGVVHYGPFGFYVQGQGLVRGKPAPVPWDKTWIANNTRFQLAYIETKDRGWITLRCARGRMRRPKEKVRLTPNWRLTVLLCEQFRRAHHLFEVEAEWTSQAQEVANWLGRTYGYKLSLPEQLDQIHVGFENTHPEIVALTKLGYRVQVLDHRGVPVYAFADSKERWGERSAEMDAMVGRGVDGVADVVSALRSMDAILEEQRAQSSQQGEVNQLVTRLLFKLINQVGAAPAENPENQRGEELDYVR